MYKVIRKKVFCEQRQKYVEFIEEIAAIPGTNYNKPVNIKCAEINDCNDSSICKKMNRG